MKFREVVILFIIFIAIWLLGGFAAHSQIAQTKADKAWFDTPFVKGCCNEGDAYLANNFEWKDGRFYAILDDGYNYYRHMQVFPPGTEIEVPPVILEHMNNAPKNPTGQGLIFVAIYADYEDSMAGQTVYCYFMPSAG